MRLPVAIAIAALGILLPGSGDASPTTSIAVSPKHGHRYSTYVISFSSPYATSRAAGTDYGIGAINSGDCARGISSFGRIQYGPYKKGQTVRFVIRYPHKGLCVGVFHGVVKFQRKVGDRIRDTRLGRFGFRVLSG